MAGKAGVVGSADGVGADASFNAPRGIALNSVTGDLFVADYGNEVIRKITPTGVVTTFSGTVGYVGSSDGNSIGAQFNNPNSTVVDPISGDIYVADQGNNLIRKITSAGVTTVLAGAPPSSDGTGSAARFNWPTASAVDASGNIYIADLSQHVIRKITPAGIVTTLAGKSGINGSDDGVGTAATFSAPAGIAVDGSGNVYVADSFNHLIRKITPTGVVTTFAGTVGVVGEVNGAGAAASFNAPRSIAVDTSGNVYVADSFNHLIRKITPTGVVTTFAGRAGIAGAINATGTTASFNSPSGVTVDASGNVFVADSGNQLIRKITSAGVVTTFAGTYGVAGDVNGTGTAASFSDPSGVAADTSGNVYVADSNNSLIRKITSAGVVSTFAGVSNGTDGTGTAASFRSPAGLALDASGNIYVADFGNQLIRKITAAGVVTTLAGRAGVVGAVNGLGTAASFNGPMGVAVDSSGNVYVADQGNHLIRKITSAGVVSTLAGKAGIGGSTNATGTAASFNGPTGVAVDASGVVYVADQGNQLIRKISSSGVVTTLAGQVGIIGATNGTGVGASFFFPNSLAVDTSGNVYVADAGNHLIRKITSAGVVTTLAGQAGVRGATNGTGIDASFKGPMGVTVDASGNIYVADQGNYLIRKITPTGVVTTLLGVTTEPGVRFGRLTSGTVRLSNPNAITYVPSRLIILINHGIVTLPLMK